MCLIHDWLYYAYKNQYDKHEGIRKCQKCGLKQIFIDPTLSTENYVDAKMGKTWRDTEKEIPVGAEIYDKHKNRRGIYGVI